MQCTDILSKGIYTISDASKLTGISKSTFRSWVSSYRRYNSKQYKNQRHFWNPDFIECPNKIFLTFKDIMESRFVAMFRKHNISFKKITSAATYLSQELQVMSPFSYRKFETDGISILAFNSENKTRLDTFTNHFYLPELDILMKDEEISAIKTDTGLLIDGIDYDSDGIPKSWKPSIEQYPDILIRPTHHTGRPMIDDLSVHALYIQFEAGEDTKSIASLYKTKEEYVVQACNFYQEIML